MSGGEGWGLPEFHSVALGKYGVIMNAHGYKSWANKDNCILVNPNSKIPAYDGIFFQEGQPYSQGNIYDFDGDDFISACEEAVKKVEENKLNDKGLKLQEDFSTNKFIENLLTHIE